MIFGITVLIATFSFLIYKHPPATWPFSPLQQLQAWTRRLQIGGSSRLESTPNDDKTTIYKTARALSEEPNGHEKPTSSPRLASQTASPGSSPTTPKATPILTAPTQSVPSFSLSEESAPSTFPALNSAQRVSSSRPPQLAPLSNPSMPPPPRPLPNRGPPSSSSSLALPPTASSIPPKPRKKVVLSAGHSPLDWARLQTSGANLRGLPPSAPLLRVPPSLLRQHNKRSSAWTVLGGKVYNITPYLGFHPGGEGELMKGAGRDGEKAFMEVHPWVNWENMLGNCLVGVAVAEGEAGTKGENKWEEMD